MTPGYVDENAGISYAKKGDIEKSLTDYYKESANPLVRVSDAFAGYAGRYGIKADALSYGNGAVMIGGKPIDIMFTDDSGKAWARQSAVTNALDDYISAAGQESPVDLAARYEREYLSNASSIANSLRNMGEFKYKPDSDPVYLAYREKYLSEGGRAAEDSMAAYSALTGGYANSAAASAAAQAEQYYAKKLTDTIPVLAKQAYQRYIDRYNNKLDLLNSMTDMYDRAYKNADNANSQQRDNINKSAASNVSRDNSAYKRNTEAEAAKRGDYWEDLFNTQKYDKNTRDAYWDEVFNTQNITKNEYENEGLRLSNAQKHIYQQYYEKLLQEELRGDRLDNDMIQAKLNWGILK